MQKPTASTRVAFVASLFLVSCGGHTPPQSSAANAAEETTPPSDTNPPSPSESSSSDTMSDDESTMTMRNATAAGVTFEWRLDATHLHGRMSAETTGWVTIGFNKERELAGTKLLMGRILSDGTAQMEEHIADPPNHRPKTELGGHHALTNVRGAQIDGITTLEFSLELVTGDPVDVELQAGMPYHVTFAWSRDDDFYHHSAQRSALDLNL